ncbi:NTPase [Salmonella enterica]|nr:NTPase [Salmonella enterica]
MENTEITFEYRDEFNRKPIAANLIKLLDSDIDISPMIIDGMWGTGKTEFCHKIINKMKSRDSKVIYIDAFSDDHADSPLLTILSSIISLIPAENNSRTDFIKKAIPALRFVGKTAMKASVSWFLKQEADKVAEEFQEAVNEISNKAIDNTVETILNDHIESQKNINSLRDALNALSNGEKITIFIDELDRCKPNFAVSILECIKHIFNVPNVSFVLVTNTRQLIASINHVYGASVDAKKYLDKFIRFSYFLPERSQTDYDTDILASQIHWKTLASEKEDLIKIKNKFERDMNYLIECNSLSLRDTEKFARYLEILQKIDNGKIGDILYGPALAKLIAVYVFCFNTKTAIDTLNNKSKLLDILKTFNIQNFNFQLSTDETPNIIIALFNIFKNHQDMSSIHTNLNEETIQNWVAYISRSSGSPASNLLRTFNQTINKLLLK